MGKSNKDRIRLETTSCLHNLYVQLSANTAQEMKFSIKFYWSHLLKKSLMETILLFIFNHLTLFVVGSKYPLFLVSVGKTTYLAYLLKSLLIAILIFRDDLKNC